MILKEADNRAWDIDELERIAREHPHASAAAQSELSKIRKGLQGEGSAAHFLNRELRESTRTAILHDIRIECAEGGFAQIDHLIINRIQGIAWVLETKNYSGNMSCNEHGEWTVYYGKKPESIQSPVAQARRQASALEQWLKKNKISGINKVVPVVLVSPKSHINRKHLRADEHVIKSDNFSRWYEDQLGSVSAAGALLMAGRFAMSGLSPDGLRKLGEKLVEANQPARFDWEARMKVKGGKARTPAPSKPAVAAHSSHGIPEKIATPHGDITIRSVGQDYAIKNPPHPDIIEIVKGCCKGKGKWNPRYSNWLVGADRIAEVAQEISKKLVRL